MIKTSDWLSDAWAMFAENPVVHIVLTLIVAVGSSITGGLLAGPLICGYIWVVIRQMEDPGYDPQIGDIGKCFENFVQTFLVGIVGGIIAGIGGVLCGIGAILTAPLVMFAFPLVAHRQMGFWEAIQTSIAKVMENYGGWIVFALILGLINAAGGLVAVGWLITYPLTIVAVVLAYRDNFGLGGAQPDQAPEGPLTPPQPEQ
ncbi:MAG: hypothetical protein ACP5KN_07075 [Armatimonadota bacterium]